MKLDFLTRLPRPLKSTIKVCVEKSRIHSILPLEVLKIAIWRDQALRLCPDATASEPTRDFVIGRIASYLGSQDVFVDLGCGRGHVLSLIARTSKLKRVIGIEIVPEIVQIAKKRVAKSGALTPVDIMEGDASKVDISQGTVYYLFNPFGEETLRKVIENIRDSLRSNPREICIIYNNSKYSFLFGAPLFHLDDRMTMELSQDSPYPVSVWRNFPNTDR